MRTLINEPTHLQPDGISRKVHPWPVLIGSYFSFRISITFLWFQANPVTGNAVTQAIGLAILVGTTFYTVDERTETIRAKSIPATVKWIGVFLSFALLSVMWTVTQSYLAALGYWVGLFTDVTIVWLIVRCKWDSSVVYCVLSGFVWGACAVAAIAWLSPTAEDMRLGNEEFMHPNLIGWEIALATLFAQYLSRVQKTWLWIAIGLAITQVRTLSKTSLIAFAFAETFYLLKSSSIRRRTRMYIASFAVVVIVLFWGWLEAYAETYASEGNSLETLTGRTILWSTTLSMAFERPWIGHGIHSFRALIPPLGTFEPWHAHNEILQQFFAYGVVGIVLTAGVYWSLFRQARRSIPSDLRTLVLSLVIMSLIRGLTDTDRFDLSLPFWLITLLAFSLVKESCVNRAQTAT